MEIFAIIWGIIIIVILQVSLLYLPYKRNNNDLTDKKTFSKIYPIICIILIMMIVLSLFYFMYYEEGLRFLRITEGSFISTCVALIAICTTIIVGYQIFNAIEYKNKISKLEDEYLKSINERKNYDLRLKKADADHSRMIANILKHNKKPIWAMGWIAKSSRIYGDWLKRLNGDSHYKNVIELDQEFFYNTRESLTKTICDCIVMFRNHVCETYKKDDSEVQNSNDETRLKKSLEYILNMDNEYGRRNELIIRTFKDIMLAKLCKKTHSIDVFYDNDIQKCIINDFLILICGYLSEEDIERAVKISGLGESDKEKLEKEIQGYTKGNDLTRFFCNLIKSCKEYNRSNI